MHADKKVGQTLFAVLLFVVLGGHSEIVEGGMECVDDLKKKKSATLCGRSCSDNDERE